MGFLPSLSSELGTDQTPQTSTMLDTRVTAAAFIRPFHPEVGHAACGTCPGAIPDFTTYYLGISGQIP